MVEKEVSLHIECYNFKHFFQKQGGLMKGLSETTIWEFLEFIQEKVKANVVQIKINNTNIMGLQKLPSNTGINITEQLLTLNERNKELSDENYMLLDMHKNIMALKEKYNWKISANKVITNEQPKIVEKVISAENWIRKIKKGEVDLNDPQQYIYSEPLYTELCKIMLAREMYEECSILKKVKDKENKSISDNKKSFGLLSKFINRIRNSV